MKKQELSVENIFFLVKAGTFITILILAAGIFFITKSTVCVLVCLVTSLVLSIWAVVFVHVLRNRISLFTSDICQTIDDMMKETAVPAAIYDEDTLLDRICCQLNRLYQTQQANKKELEKQQSELQGMISDISHQLKTPATNLKMAASALLEQEHPRGQQIEYLEVIHTQINKIDFLMAAMIKSARLETGIITLKKQKASIYETLAVSLSNIYWKAEEKELKVRVDCPNDLLIPHDPKWTSEALFNILENSVNILQTAVRFLYALRLGKPLSKLILQIQDGES